MCQENTELSKIFVLSTILKDILFSKLLSFEIPLYFIVKTGPPSVHLILSRQSDYEIDTLRFQLRILPPHLLLCVSLFRPQN